MKGVTKIVVAIALLAISVLSIVVATVAWFTSNPNVDADSVTLNAARTLTVTFESDIDGSSNNKGDRYGGQTGRGATGTSDAPYVYEAGSFTALIRPSASNMGGTVKITFGTVTVSYGRDPSSYTAGTISGILITDLFTISANCYEKSAHPDTEDENDNFIKDNGIYIRDDGTHVGEQHYKKTTYVVDDDGFLKDHAGGDIVVFEEGDYGFTFTFTFLPESAYALWSAERYDEIYGYRPNSSGAYTGLPEYVAYKEKYHSTLTRYTLEDGHATVSPTGDYVRVATSYEQNGSVQKYVKAGDVYTKNNATGTYVKVGDSDDYVLYESLSHFDRVEGFPFCDRPYSDATYTFDVTCAVEEEEVA